MPKLLLVTYAFPPCAACAAFRMLGFARYLPKFGWQVTVVAPPSMPREPLDPALSQLIPPETAVIRVPYPRSHLLKPARRLAPDGVWLPNTWLACRRAVRHHPPDALLTSGPPHCVHLLGLLLKRRYRLPWIADFRDPWVASEWPKSRATLRTCWEPCAEKAVIKNADAIVTCAPGGRDCLQNAYAAYRGKMFTITNGYDPESFSRRTTPASVHDSLRVVHTGELHYGSDPRPFRPFLDALRAYERDALGPKRIQARFIGRTYELAAEVQQRGLEEIVHTGTQVPYGQALEEMAGADILLLLHSPGIRMGIPAKLFEYLGAGRPILALAEPESDVAWVLKESGRLHQIVQPTDPDKIKQALMELVKEVTEGLVPPVREKPVFRFTRETMAKSLAETLSRCLCRDGSSVE